MQTTKVLSLFAFMAVAACGTHTECVNPTLLFVDVVDGAGAPATADRVFLIDAAGVEMDLTPCESVPSCSANTWEGAPAYGDYTVVAERGAARATDTVSFDVPPAASGSSDGFETCYATDEQYLELPIP